MVPNPKLNVHHFGCLTRDISKSLEVYRLMGFNKVSAVYAVTSQNVKVCFIEIGEQVYLELVEFNEDNAALSKIFKSKNPYYHVGYLVNNIQSVIEHFQAQGFYLVNQFNSEAFNGKMCAFLYSPEMHLIELIET